MRTTIIMTTLLLSTSVGFGKGANPNQQAERPCKQIVDACTKTGFSKGEAKEGKGLWMNCVNPLMQGTTAKKSVVALPSVDSSVISACKGRRPKFGAGKVGN